MITLLFLIRNFLKKADAFLMSSACRRCARRDVIRWNLGSVMSFCVCKAGVVQLFNSRFCYWWESPVCSFDLQDANDISRYLTI